MVCEMTPPVSGRIGSRPPEIVEFQAMPNPKEHVMAMTRTTTST